MPAHWQVERLKWVATAVPSNIDKLTVEGEQAVLLCNYLDVYRNDRITGTLDFMRASASPEQIEKLSLRVDDCIITKDSEDPSDIGVPAYVEEIIPNLVCGYHLSIVRPKVDELSGRFLFYALKAEYVRAAFQVGSNGLTRYGLGRYAMDNLELATPSPSEQVAIACFLDRETAKIDGLIAEQERLIALLKEKRKAVIFHAVTKGLDPNAPMKDSGVEWLGEVPAHWEVSPLKRWWSVTDCKHVTAEFVAEGFPVASIRESQSRYLDLSAAKQTTPEFFDLLREGGRAPEPGDLIFTRNATVGESAQVAEWHPPFAMGQDVCLLRKRRAACSSDFVWYILHSLPIERQLAHLMIGSTFKRINVEEVRSLVVTTPPDEEARAISATLDRRLGAFDQTIAEATSAILLLQERRSALISAAVTGKIDVRNLAPAAADAA